MKKIRFEIKQKSIQFGLFTIGLFTQTISPLAHSSESHPSIEALNHIQKIYSEYNIDTAKENLSQLLNANINSRCIGDMEDPFDFGAEMRAGPYRGECMDLSNNRPVLILKGDSQSDELVVANIRYKGKFWIGKIKKNSVQNVQFEMIKFGTLPIDLSKITKYIPTLDDDSNENTTDSDLANETQIPSEKDKKSNVIDALTAHTQFRFLFAEPMELESQVVSDTQPLQKETLSDLTFTFNAFGVNGVGYDVEAGISGTFGLVGKAIATVDRSVEEIIWDKSIVELFPIQWDNVIQRNLKLKNEGQKINSQKLTAEGNMYHLLYSSFKHSQNMGLKASYHTTFRNCTTEAFDLWDEAFPELLSKNGGTAMPFLLSYFKSKELLSSSYRTKYELGKTSNQLYDESKALVNSALTPADFTNLNLSYLPNINTIRLNTLTNESSFLQSIWTSGKSKLESINKSLGTSATGQLALTKTEELIEFAEDYNIGSFFPYSIGIAENIADLAYGPSIQNLKDRGLWSEAIGIQYLNTEYSKNNNKEDFEGAREGICKQTTTCERHNARNTMYPTTGVKAKVEALIKAKKEAAELAEKNKKATDEKK